MDAVVEKEFVTLGTDNGLVSRVNVTYLLPKGYIKQLRRRMLFVGGVVAAYFDANNRRRTG